MANIAKPSPGRVAMFHAKTMLALLFFLLASPAWADLPLYEVAAGSRELGEFPVKMVVDPAGTMSIEQVAALPAEGRLKSSRFILPAEPGKVWLGLALENKSGRPVSRLIGFDEPHLVKADLFILENGRFRRIRNGLAVPYSLRPYHSRLPVFRLELAPGQKKNLYLLATSAYPNTTVGVFVSGIGQFERSQLLHIILQCLYLGALGALVVYNLFLFLSLKERLYLFYVVHGVLFGMFVYSYSGLAVLSDISAVNFNRFGAATTASQGFFLLFTRDILSTRLRLPKWDKAMVGLICLLFLLACLVFANTNNYQYLVMLSMPLMLLQLGLGIHAAARGLPMGKFYLLGTSWYLLGVLVLAALNQGLLPHNLFTRYGFLLGSFAELMVLSLALAYRVKLLQEEKSAYQQELVLKNQTEKQRLEKLVGERTAELRKVNRELETLSSHDGLTGLYNRRVFDLELARQSHTARRNRTNLALILCDVDHFKLYNDELGHQAGDECLRAVAATIQSQCKRATDFCARYGGEEFVVLLPGADKRRAAEQAERIRAAVERAGMPHPASSPGRVTISLGVACQPVGETEGTPEDLLARADQALYESKGQGRNRVTMAGA